MWAPSRRAFSAKQRVALLTTLLAAVEILLIWWLRDAEPIVPEVSISPVALAALFGIVEWRVVHIQFRAEASSFSLLEVPLVLGLLYLPPAELVLTATLGIVLGLVLARHQSPMKIVFNIVNIGLYCVVAWLVVDALAPSGSLDPAVWLVVFAATAMGSSLSVGGILAAISLTEGPPGWRPARRLVGFALAMSAATTALGLVAAILLPIDAFGIVLLLVPAAMVLLAFQMFASERAQRERVEFLYRSSRLLDDEESERGPTALLEAAREMFRSEIAALVLLPDGDSPATASVKTDGDPQVRQALGAADAILLREAFERLTEPMRVRLGDGNPVAEMVCTVGGQDAIVARMATDDRDLGILIIANRLGEANDFSDGDVQVLAALASQSGVLLHNDRLEQALVELQELEGKLAHQATHDALTGLPNRSLFTRHLDEVSAGSDPFAVFFIDLDDFKIVNDTRGHAVGDRLLVEVAKRIECLLRPIDVAARLGGDEFAVLVRDHPFPREVADRIVTSISDPIELGADGIALVGCSIGIAHSGSSREPQDMLQQADLAMYQAKRTGKRGAVEYEPGADRELGFKANLRDAISAGQLELHYQPVIDLAAQRVCGVEALVRWRSPDRGLLLPGEFIAQAENDGFIIPIDRWVLEHATADLARLEQERDDLFMAVNISARHLQAPDLVEHIAALAPGADGFQQRLLIEVTETALMGEIERSRTNVEAIRALGIRFALDDFGTGYSSIGYLRQFNIDVLKIARPFVTAAVETDRDREFVQAMIELGHALGLQIVGEGIERPEEAEALAALGCEMAQGFLFARPMPLADVVSLLRREAALKSRPEIGLLLR